MAAGGESDGDHEVLRRLVRGDASAFDAIVRTHQDRVFRLALALLNSREDARDAAQEVFLRVEASLGVIERMGQFSADPRAALLLAQNSIKEVYEQKGQKAEAVGVLRKILEGLDDPAVRTAVHFAIADIYKETGQRDRVLEELRQVVAENKALLGRKR